MDILAAILVITLAAAAFAVWVFVRVAGWILRGIVNLVRGPQADAVVAPPVVGYAACPQPRCQAANVPHARFCRRCGSMVSGTLGAVPSQRPVMRYVA